MAISFGVPTNLAVSGALTVGGTATVASTLTLSSTTASSLLYGNASKGVSSVVLSSNLTLTTGTLALAADLTGVNSITAAAGQNATLTGGSSGASLVLGQGATSGSATFIPTGTINDASTSATQLRVGKSSASRIKLQFDTSDTTYTNRLWYIENVGSLGLLNFGRNGLDVMGLSNSGNLLIGTTTDMSGSGGLKVAGTTPSTSTTSGSGIFGGGIGVAGAITAGDNITANVAGRPTLNLNALSTANAGASVFLKASSNGSGTRRTWALQTDTTVASDFAIQQSTTEGGSTYTNALYFDASRNATFSGGIAAVGSMNSYNNGEIHLGVVGNNGGYSGIATSAINTPTMAFDHRGAANTGDWTWRNNGAATARMTLSGAGALSVAGATNGLTLAPRDGTGESYSLYNPTGDDFRVYSSAGGADVFTASTTAATLRGSLTVGGGLTVTGTSQFNVTAGLSINNPSGVAALNIYSAASTPGVVLEGTAGRGLNLYTNVGVGSTVSQSWSPTNVNIPLTTSATSSTVGALTIGNGTALTNVAIGGGLIHSGGAIRSGASGTLQGVVTVYSGDTGTAEGNIAGRAGGGLLLNTNGNNYPIVLNGSAVSLAPSPTASASVTVPGTLSATSSTAGAFLVGNGTAATNVAIGGGKINAGADLAAVGISSSGGISNTVSGDSNLRLTSTTAVTGRDWYLRSTSSGAFDVFDNTGGGRRFSIDSTGAATFSSTTSATSSTSGALTVGNGTAATNVAIGGGNVNAGGTGYFGSTLRLTNATESEIQSYTGAAYTPHTVDALSYAWKTSGGTADMTIGTTGIVGISNGTPSTLPTNGAVVISGTGGLGVGGAINAGGAINTSASSGNPTVSATMTAAGGAGQFPLFQLLDGRAGGTNWNIENGRTLGLLSFRSSSGDQLTINGATGAATFNGVTVLKNYTVATLPAAASYTYGTAFVSDATNAAGTGSGTAPTGGGAVVRLVYCTGAAWLLV